MKKQYNKLVRDNIPTMIHESGRKCKIRTLSDEDYREALLDKIVEEVEEFRVSSNEEELADIYEVVGSLVEFLGYEPMHIDYIKMKKKESQGPYKNRIFLEEVEELQ